MAGLTPISENDLNNSVGQILRQFVNVQEGVHHTAGNLAPLDLTKDPYNMSAADETTIKSAVNGLDAALQGVDMTFINRLIGMWV
jgi:hypothetical protein